MEERGDKGILGIAQAYGPYRFWLENLIPDSTPDATWRGLMVVAALRDKAFCDQAIELLKSHDSRVRAKACYYLGNIQHTPASNNLFALTCDPSIRVRHFAHRALAKLQPGGKNPISNRRRFPHKKLRVLISEDDRRAREQLARVIERIGCVPYAADTEQNTIATARSLLPQVIITDNQKGKDNLSGLNMTWDLCRIPQLRETILIMVTADEVEPAFLWNGGDYFFQKGPFTLQKLQLMLPIFLQ
jgi:CheY-like chemotaxis protein